MLDIVSRARKVEVGKVFESTGWKFNYTDNTSNGGEC